MEQMRENNVQRRREVRQRRRFVLFGHLTLLMVRTSYPYVVTHTSHPSSSKSLGVWKQCFQKG